MLLSSSTTPSSPKKKRHPFSLSASNENNDDGKETFMSIKIICYILIFIASFVFYEDLLVARVAVRKHFSFSVSALLGEEEPQSDLIDTRTVRPEFEASKRKREHVETIEEHNEKQLIDRVGFNKTEEIVEEEQEEKEGAEMALQIEKEVSFKTLLQCPVRLKIDPGCVRVMHLSRTFNSGLGHQLSEMLFSMHLSQTHRAALKFEGFPRRKSRHGTDYTFITELLGLQALLENSAFRTAHLVSVPMYDTTNVGCGVVIAGNYKDCPGGSCFLTPHTNLLFHKYSRCLQSLANACGTWRSFDPYERDTFNIAWHIRVGDIEPHPAGDSFYAHVYESLSRALTEHVEVNVFFIGEWSILSKHKKAEYEAFLIKTVPSARFLDLEIKDALLHMMHSDILVGSGSTLPMIAALFSDRTLYVNVKPKTGWNFLNDFISDGLITSGDGAIINHIFETREKLLQRREAGNRTVATCGDIIQS